jgi:hypothetical protein
VLTDDALHARLSATAATEGARLPRWTDTASVMRAALAAARTGA